MMPPAAWFVAGVVASWAVSVVALLVLVRVSGRQVRR